MILTPLPSIPSYILLVKPTLTKILYIYHNPLGKSKTLVQLLIYNFQPRKCLHGRFNLENLRLNNYLLKKRPIALRALGWSMWTSRHDAIRHDRRNIIEVALRSVVFQDRSPCGRHSIWKQRLLRQKRCRCWHWLMVTKQPNVASRILRMH